jgi:hypothetical protein
MSIKIRNTVRESLSRAVFCLLIALPMGAGMAATKSPPRPNRFMQNPAQAGQTGSYTTQNGVVTPGALAVPAAQGAIAASDANATSTRNETTTRGTPQKTGGGGL